MSSGADASDVSLKREVLSGTTAKIGLQVVAFAATILFARLLSPTDFGTYYLLLSLVTVASLPAVGWFQAAFKRFSEDVSQQRRSEIVGSQLILILIAIGICAVAVVIFDSQIRGYIGVHSAPTLLFILLTTIIIYEIYRSLVKARGKVGIVFWTDFLRESVAVGLQIGLVLIGLSVVGMVAGYVAATLIALPIVVIHTATRPSIPSRETILSLWEYARYSILNSVLGTAYYRFDTLLLGFLLVPATVSYYEIAYRLSMPAILIAQVSSVMIMSRVSNLESKNQTAHDDISNTLAYSSLLAPPLFFGSIAVADNLIVVIYGTDFVDAAPLLVGLALYHSIRSQGVIYMHILGGWDRPDLYMWIAAITLVTNIILGVVLTLAYGAIGVVIATVLSEAGKYALMVLVVSRRLPLSVLFPRELFYQVVSGALMLLILMTIKQPLPEHGPIPLGTLLAIGAGVYFGSLFVLSSQFRSSTASTLRKSPLFN